MHRKRRYFVFLVGLLCLLCAGAEARASQSTLVLGIQLNGKLHEPSRRAVIEWLKQQGEGLVQPTREPSARDLLCERPDCLAQLARRERAAALLGGKIAQSGRSYEIRLWLYHVKAENTAEREALCPDCDDTQLLDLVARTAGELLSGSEVTCPRCPKCPEGAPAPLAAPTTPPAGVTPPPPVVGLSGRQKAGGVLFGVSLGLLFVGVPFTAVTQALDGLGTCRDYPRSPPCMEFYRTEALYTAGYIVSGVAVGGAILGAVLRWAPSKKGTP